MKGSQKTNLGKVLLAASLAIVFNIGTAGASLATESEYVPPPEAFEGPGGWAVVDPRTGTVYGVIVGDWDEQTWEEVKNTRTVDGYMGCPAPCELRFQTRATEDGNVAGWHGTQTNVDEDGNATQSNDGSVRYDQASGTFEITNQAPDGTKTTQILVPEKTSRDSEGKGRTMDLSSGITDIKVSKRVASGDVSASISTYRSSLSDETVDVSIAIPGVTQETSLEYVFAQKAPEVSGQISPVSQVRSDVTSLLLSLGFTKTVTSFDEETGEEISVEVLDESNVFVGAVLNVTQGIMDFLDSILGWFQAKP